MWRDYFEQTYAVVDGMLICTANYLDHGKCFSYPVGTGSLEATVDFLKRYCADNNTPLRFCCVPEEGVVRLTEILGQPYEKLEYRDWADYLYPYENFLGYHGKKLVTQRNHCNRFLRDNPEYEYIPIDRSLISEAKEFMVLNSGSFKKDSELAREEYVRAVEVLDLFSEFGFTGGLLKVNGQVIGLSVGEKLGDTLYVHIEKALQEYSGVYPFLASLYAKQNACDDLLYINREDDSGDPGLRHSKLEYRPCGLIGKFVVSFKA